MGEQPEDVFIYYPMNDDNGCHYVDSLHQIHITGIDVDDTKEPSTEATLMGGKFYSDIWMKGSREMTGEAIKKSEKIFSLRR